jgi:hypothetical protein
MAADVPDLGLDNVEKVAKILSQNLVKTASKITYWGHVQVWDVGIHWAKL